MLVHSFLDSPVGRLKLVASATGLVAVLWPTENPKRVPLESTRTAGEDEILSEARHQLLEYFNGARQVFALPLDLRGTEFQRRVWHLLQRIPFGQTRSYGELARELGDSGATRAVGAANGRNPLSIVVPCHRVIGASGALTGFAGGTEVKRYLLELEGASQTQLSFSL